MKKFIKPAAVLVIAAVILLGIDVYKRQELVTAMVSVYNNEIILSTDGRRDYFLAASGSETIKPVSYTHLDVYKRQHQNDAAV